MLGALGLDETENSEPIENGGGFAGFGASTAAAIGTIGARAIRSFGDAEMNGEKCATKLIGEVPIAARKRRSDRVPENESFARSDIDIETFVREVHEWLLGGLAAVFCDPQAKAP